MAIVIDGVQFISSNNPVVVYPIVLRVTYSGGIGTVEFRENSFIGTLIATGPGSGTIDLTLNATEASFAGGGVSLPQWAITMQDSAFSGAASIQLSVVPTAVSSSITPTVNPYEYDFDFTQTNAMGNSYDDPNGFWYAVTSFGYYPQLTMEDAIAFSIAFDGTASTPVFAISSAYTSTEWNFGDSHTSTSKHVTHEYGHFEASYSGNLTVNFDYYTVYFFPVFPEKPQIIDFIISVAPSYGWYRYDDLDALTSPVFEPFLDPNPGSYTNNSIATGATQPLFNSTVDKGVFFADGQILQYDIDANRIGGLIPEISNPWALSSDGVTFWAEGVVDSVVSIAKGRLDDFDIITGFNYTILNTPDHSTSETFFLDIALDPSEQFLYLAGVVTDLSTFLDYKIWTLDLTTNVLTVLCVIASGSFPGFIFTGLEDTNISGGALIGRMILETDGSQLFLNLGNSSGVFHPQDAIWIIDAVTGEGVENYAFRVGAEADPDHPLRGIQALGGSQSGQSVVSRQSAPRVVAVKKNPIRGNVQSVISH